MKEPMIVLNSKLGAFNVYFPNETSVLVRTMGDQRIEYKGQVLSLYLDTYLFKGEWIEADFTITNHAAAVRSQKFHGTPAVRRAVNEIVSAAIAELRANLPEGFAASVKAHRISRDRACLQQEREELLRELQRINGQLDALKAEEALAS